MSKDEVLIAIRRLAVREESTLVARATLLSMRQDRDEPVHAFVARLCGQAGMFTHAQGVAMLTVTWKRS